MWAWRGLLRRAGRALRLRGSNASVVLAFSRQAADRTAAGRGCSGGAGSSAMAAACGRDARSSRCCSRRQRKVSMPTAKEYKATLTMAGVELNDERSCSRRAARSYSSWAWSTRASTRQRSRWAMWRSRRRRSPAGVRTSAPCRRPATSTRRSMQRRWRIRARDGGGPDPSVRVVCSRPGPGHAPTVRRGNIEIAAAMGLHPGISQAAHEQLDEARKGVAREEAARAAAQPAGGGSAAAAPASGADEAAEPGLFLHDPKGLQDAEYKRFWQLMEQGHWSRGSMPASTRWTSCRRASGGCARASAAAKPSATAT